MTTSRPVTGRTLLPVFLLEPARRPVVVRRVAAARTVEGGDVLERDQDVTVELDVRHVLDVAVGREDAFLVLAPEQGDVHLLALVLVRVVLHPWNLSLQAAFLHAAGLYLLGFLVLVVSRWCLRPVACVGRGGMSSPLGAP